MMRDGDIKYVELCKSEHKREMDGEKYKIIDDPFWFNSLT